MNPPTEKWSTFSMRHGHMSRQIYLHTWVHNVVGLEYLWKISFILFKQTLFFAVCDLIKRFFFIVCVFVRRGIFWSFLEIKSALMHATLLMVLCQIVCFHCERPCLWIWLCEYINQIDSTPKLMQTKRVIQLKFARPNIYCYRSNDQKRCYVHRTNMKAKWKYSKRLLNNSNVVRFFLHSPGRFDKNVQAQIFIYRRFMTRSCRVGCHMIFICTLNFHHLPHHHFGWQMLRYI